MDILPIRTLFSGRYAIVRLIGTGGMASVYLAHDEKHDRDLAIKVLRRDLLETSAAARFDREIRVEGRLQHPHILPIFDSGSVDGLPYYVMPYVEGETLRERIAREGPLQVASALRIALEICDALAYAHQQGVIHRDVKPGNILLSDDHAVVADFGIARIIAESAAGRLTTSGAAMGTAAYMSPEQALGEEAVDERSDVYAIGCVLFEMLAGEAPFTGRSRQVVIARHISQPVPSLKVFRQSLDPELVAIVERALAKVPADRFANAGELLEALSRVSERLAAGRAGDASGESRSSLRGSGSGAGTTRGAGQRVARLVGLLAGAAVVLAAVAWTVRALRPGPVLDRNKVVVFPFWTSEGRSNDGMAVADLVRNAIDLAYPLRADDGYQRLNVDERSDVASLSTARARAISRDRGAAYYVDGRIVSDGDALHVTVLINDVEGDSVVAQATSSGPAGASAVTVGLQALVGTLGNWLDPGREFDLDYLRDRKPEAVITWMHGEREYRLMRFHEALDFYEQAVELDPQLGQAALKGAQAAAWMDRDEEADDLTRIASASAGWLPPHHQALLGGIRHYLAGQADSAVARIEEALTIRSEWAEAWMVLGETRYHLMPNETRLDSLSRHAFLQARAFDPEFTPPLHHLAELAIMAGDIDLAGLYVDTLVERAGTWALDSQLSLELTCAREGPDATPWHDVAENDPTRALGAAVMLASGARYPECAERGARAVIESSPPSWAWPAYSILLGLMVTQGRYDEMHAILESEEAHAVGVSRSWLLLSATGDPELRERARSVASTTAERLPDLRSSNLWLLGQWYLSRDSVEAGRRVLDILEGSMGPDSPRADSVFRSSLHAQLNAATAAPADAILELEELRRTANKGYTIFYPAEALDRERLMLAELHLSFGRARQAWELAEEIDSHRAIVHLTFLRMSLDIRLRAARALGLEGAEREIEQRIVALRGVDRAQ